MNSINEERLRNLLGALFDVLLACPAERGPFPMAGDATRVSYYVERPQPAPRRADFTAASSEGVNHLQQRLAAHWQSCGRPELMPQASQVAAVAFELRAHYARSQLKPELSPYIYSMF